MQGDGERRCRRRRRRHRGSEASEQSHPARIARARSTGPAARPTSDRVEGSAPPDGASCSSTTRRTVSTISVKRMRPAWNASTHSSLAALKTAGWCRPRRPPAGPARRPGTRRRPAAGSPMPAARVQSTGGVDVRQPLGPRQPEGDGHEHARWAGLGDGRAVDELDHRVDQLLRVHDDLDALERDVEEQVGLDHLQPLVDQRGRVGRDHPAHGEVGVGQRLLGRDVVQRGSVAAEERAAARRQHQAAHLVAAPDAQALGDGRVLGVDRHDLAGRGERPSPAGRRR